MWLFGDDSIDNHFRLGPNVYLGQVRAERRSQHSGAKGVAHLRDDDGNARVSIHHSVPRFEVGNQLLRCLVEIRSLESFSRGPRERNVANRIDIALNTTKVVNA